MPRRKGQLSPILRTTPSPSSSTEGTRRPSPSFDFPPSGGPSELSDALLASLSAQPKEGLEELPGTSHRLLPGSSHRLLPPPAAFSRKRRRSQMEPGAGEPPPRTRSRMALTPELPAQLSPVSSARSASRRPSPAALSPPLASPQPAASASSSHPHTASPAPLGGFPGLRTSAALFPDMCCVAGSHSQRCQLPRHHPHHHHHHHGHEHGQHSHGHHAHHHHQPAASQAPAPQPQPAAQQGWPGAPAAQPAFLVQQQFPGQTGFPVPFLQAPYAQQHLLYSLMSTMSAVAGRGEPSVPLGLWENQDALLQVAQHLANQCQHPRGLTKAQIAQLPTLRYHGRLVADEGEGGADGDQEGANRCVVCLNGFQPRQSLRLLPCRHHFHSKCIDKWLKTNRTCPICRGDASHGLRKGL